MEKQIDCDFTFVWIIKNFSMCHYRELEHVRFYVDSPCFVANSLPGKKWRLLLYPKGYEPDSEHVSICLCRRDDIPEDCKLSCSFQFFDRNGKEIFSEISDPAKIISFLKEHPDRGYGFPRFIERSVLLKSVICDILIIKCSLKPVPDNNEEEIHLSLSYKTELFTDVLLRARGAEFKVHKAILWARWPQLAKKLDEQKSSEQDFDIESSVLEAMIDYVYTGKFNLIGYVFNFEEVYMTAAKYGLRILGPTPGNIKTCETRLYTRKLSFVWSIDNFSSLPVNTELHHEFKTNIPEFSKWSLRLRVCEKKETDQIFDVFVYNKPEPQLAPIFVRSKVSFDDDNSSENEHFFKTDENWKCAQFSRNISSNPEDILLLKCEFKLSDGSAYSKILESSCIFATSLGDSNLKRSLRNLYENGTLSDVTVVAKSRRFSVHKFILCSQSSVFCRMFETEMTESRNDQVEIPDVDSDIMHQMLLFLYTGNVEELSEETVIQLYGVAEKYDVSALKNVCKLSVTVANVLKILQLAIMHHVDNLYQSALEFFSDHLQEIYSTDEWKERSDNNFCVKILQDVIARNKPTK
ncbi:speckle-type POZ protein-like [Stegodyphus dumicola]|uniref:speckle-type POZ protein-like n=1 Tax=Stegodyphus dumicola TaxID=202533 RepID=UPI0015A93327|nr:speckle-type POZ protein-like [Stegodyphus dumicola]